MKPPKVSIVLPTYNRYEKLLKCLSCIEDQKFKDFELILIDDGSTDETKSIVTILSTEMRGKTNFIRNIGNLGAIKSYNIGFKQAIGEYITWISVKS